MSAPEIVVGACYRDPTDGEIVRAIAVEPDGWWHCVTVRPGRSSGCVGNDIVCALSTWERVPDPTPAVIDDAKLPLAGELTARQFFTWAATQDADRAPRVHVSCTGGMWTATLTVCPPGQDRVTQRSASARDPQDALTALMSEAP